VRRSTLFTSVASAAFLFGTGATVAQDWDWTPDHEHGFYQRFSREPVRVPPPSGFGVTVGGVVPEGVEVYEAPSDYDYAPARRYRYTSYDKRIYVIDPKTRKVVRIIEK
jgi:hypothetical protein